MPGFVSGVAIDESRGHVVTTERCYLAPEMSIGKSVPV
jgi:hypothetical protein